MLEVRVLLICVAIFSPHIVCLEERPVSPQKQLIKHLLENYETIGLPVHNISETVQVKFGAALIQITELNEKSQTLKVLLWERYSWNDPLLTWNPEEFGGVTNLRIPNDKIWKPDLVLVNGKTKSRFDAQVVVQSNGEILWVNNVDVESSCTVDVFNFPHDGQQCMLKYSSWVYDGWQLDLQFFMDDKMLDVGDYIQSNEWRLLSHPAQKNVRKYPCCEEPYPDLTFYLSMTRNAAFYRLVLVLPSILLSLLVLLIFTLPPNMADRSSLAIGLFAGFILLLLIVAEIIPRGVSAMPLIGSYLMFNTLLIILAMFLSVIVTALHNSGKCVQAKKSSQEAEGEKEETAEMLDRKDPAKKQDGLMGKYGKALGGCCSRKRFARVLDAVFCLVFLVVEIVLIIFCVPTAQES